MRPKKDQPAQQFDRAMQGSISHKLEKIVSDIKERGDAELTRLTVLKKWFGTPSRLSSFAIFIAGRASRHAGKTTKEAAQLFHEAREILADVDVFEPKIPRTRAEKLHARLQAFQNEHRESRWATLRLIRDPNLYFVESGLRVYLWQSDSPVEGYRLAADFCEHYDPRYGNGLNGPSVNRIKAIDRFILAIEAHEEAGSKSSSGMS